MYQAIPESDSKAIGVRNYGGPTKMGEYAKLNGKEIKIGTCESMYYLRYDQRYMVQHLPGNVDPVKDAGSIRFRFPWPDEDKSQPGGNGKDFDPFRALRLDDVTAGDQDHRTVQFSARNGYLVSLPCPESGQSTLKIHKNGYGGAVHLFEHRVKDGRTLMPVFRCGGCETLWRIETNEDLAPYIQSLQAQIEKAQGKSKEWHQKVLARMMVQPA